MEPYGQAGDWIETIVDKICENYGGRKVVLWGKYEVSDIIKEKLQREYGIEVTFYIDNDSAKINGYDVYSIEQINGKSREYYIVVPLAFYPSIKECLIKGGYEPDKDYCYFSDCIIREETDYYEDAHGNRIVGNYQGLKFAFSGFHSVIEIGRNTGFCNTSFYIHNNVRICIGENVRFSDSFVHLYDEASISIGNNSRFENSYISADQCADAVFSRGVQLTDSDIKLEEGGTLKIKPEGTVRYLSCFIGEQAEMLFHKKVMITADEYSRARFWMGERSRFEIGRESHFWGRSGMITIEKSALLNIGDKFSVGDFYRFNADEYTEIDIGEDCLFSNNVTIRSNDGHSIFDIMTGENINSTYEIAKSRKVVIGNHVWVGIGAVILYHTSIEDGSIIGSMSFVKGRIPNNCIAVGIPAKVSRKNIAWSHRAGVNDIEECGEKYVHLTE